MWPDFPLDPDVASESFLSQKSKPAQHQSIRTGTNVFTSKNRPSRSQCIKQRAEAQKGEGTRLKPHSKLGTEQGTGPRAPAISCSSPEAEHLQERNFPPCPGLSSPQLPALPTDSLFPCSLPVHKSGLPRHFPTNEGARNQAIKGAVQRNGSIQTPVGYHYG